MKPTTAVGFTLPDRRVWASGLVGIVVYVLGVLLRKYAGLDIDPELITPLVLAVAYGVLYMIPPGVRETLERLDALVKSAAKHPQTDTPALTEAASVIKEEVLIARENPVPAAKG